MTRRRAVGQAVATAAWTLLVAAAFFAAAAALRLDGWTLIAGQAAATAVQLVPVLVLRPPLPLGGTPGRIAVSALLIGAGTLAGAVLNPAGLGTHLRGASAAVLSGLGEETVYRGLITDRLERSGLRPLLRVVVNAALFGVLHVPVAIARGDGGAAAAIAFAFGLLFAAVREWSGGLLLPVALHVAVDLSGS